MKGPLEVDIPITSKIDKYKIWAMHLFLNNVGAENKDPRIYV